MLVSRRPTLGALLQLRELVLPQITDACGKHQLAPHLYQKAGVEQLLLICPRSFAQDRLIRLEHAAIYRCKSQREAEDHGSECLASARIRTIPCTSSQVR